MVGVAGAAAGFTLLADLADTTFRRLVTGCLVIKIVTGVLLVVLASRQWRKRPAIADQAVDAMQFLLDKMKDAKSNEDFFASMNQ